jgi:hypothetical protein
MAKRCGCPLVHLGTLSGGGHPLLSLYVLPLFHDASSVVEVIDRQTRQVFWKCKNSDAGDGG